MQSECRQRMEFVAATTVIEVSSGFRFRTNGRFSEVEQVRSTNEADENGSLIATLVYCPRNKKTFVEVSSLSSVLPREEREDP